MTNPWRVCVFSGIVFAVLRWMMISFEWGLCTLMIFWSNHYHNFNIKGNISFESYNLRMFSLLKRITYLHYVSRLLLHYTIIILIHKNRVFCYFYYIQRLEFGLIWCYPVRNQNWIGFYNFWSINHFHCHNMCFLQLQYLESIGFLLDIQGVPNTGKLIIFVFLT